jgi:dolichol-phosphate mannosyltransferase
MYKITILIPFYNESGNIIRQLTDLVGTIKKIKNCYFNITLVDDCSTDNSLIEVEKFIKKNDESIFTLIKHKKNSGKTSAIKSAFKVIKTDFIIFMDGDYQDDPKDIISFVEKIISGNEVIIGNQIKNIRFVKKIAALIYKSLLNYFLKINVITPSPQYFAIKFDYVKNLILQDNDHRYLVIISLFNNAKYCEIDVNYFNRVYGKSKFSDLKIFGAFFETIYLIYRLKKKKYKTLI